MKNKLLLTLLCLTFLIFKGDISSFAQQSIIINLTQVDGVDLSPDNLFNFQIISDKAVNTPAVIKGSIRFKQSEMYINYEFKYSIQPGLNIMNGQIVNPKYQYSSVALKELFEQYKRLPTGIFEYCVQVISDDRTGETSQLSFNECVYHKSQDIFLINLVNPDDDARLYEYNPMFNWVANFMFASALSYKIIIAEIKKGQNATTAITRNNPIYEEKQLTSPSLLYPIYAKPLEKDQYYAWKVNAYYKGILLGGSETWRFKIVEDSLLVAISKDPAFVNIKREQGKFGLYAPGLLKLKYELNDQKTDTLSIFLFNEKQKEIKLKTTSLIALYGDNRFIIDFKEEQPLKHLKSYVLLIRSQDKREYKILFKYVNPELIK